LAGLGIPLSAMPALAQDETLVPLLDFPANFELEVVSQHGLTQNSRLTTRDSLVWRSDERLTL
jgi:hypothetical protein